MRTEYAATVAGRPTYDHVGYTSAYMLNQGIERTPAGLLGLAMVVWATRLAWRFAAQLPRSHPVPVRLRASAGVTASLLLALAGSVATGWWLAPMITFHILHGRGVTTYEATLLTDERRRLMRERHREQMQARERSLKVRPSSPGRSGR